MSQVETDVRDRVAVLTLHRPERRNALSRDLAVELADAVAAAGRRTDVHAVVVTGADGTFCSGADRRLLADPDGESLRTVYRSFHAVWECPVPTVAAIDGPAVGAGMNLALAADVRVVSPRAVLDPRFVAIPVHPGGGHLWMMERAGSAQSTAAMTLLGQSLTGEDAVRRGLAWVCVPAEELVEQARALCSRVAAAPRALVVQTKATWRTVQALPDLASASELELREQLASMDTDEYRQALDGAR